MLIWRYMKEWRVSIARMSGMAIMSLFVVQLGGPAQAQNSRADTTTASPAQVRSFKMCVDTASEEEGRRTCADPLFDQCNRTHSAPDSSLAMSECYMVLNSAWDNLLNRTYAAKMAVQSPATRTALRDAQRRWIPSRKADCDAVYQVHIEGSIRTVAAASCLVEATRQRYEWLSNFGELD
jgi:uncharacterized protein YecT (DUF1311 family)